MFKFYWNVLIVLFKILRESNSYKEFLLRDDYQNSALSILGRPIMGKFYNEKKGNHIMSRQNTLLYLTIEAFKSSKEEQAGNLEFLACIIVIWAASINSGLSVGEIRRSAIASEKESSPDTE